MYRFGRHQGWGGDQPRVLGEAGPRQGAEREFQKFMGRDFPTPGGADWDPDVRLRDMDTEGTDVHMMVPAGANGHPDPWVEMEFVRTNHRFLNDFCGRNPQRL